MNTLTPCTSEDGSTQGQTFPCMWDAQTQGNGQGKSFVIDGPGGVPHYVTDIGADGTIYTNDNPAAVTVAEVGTVDPAPALTLASTGLDPWGAAMASGLVIIGSLMVAIRRMCH